jgi:sugar/nucleoside kinase (ribokinase family)
MGTPALLVVGHVTRDIQADGASRLGGTALYAAVAAARLGCRVTVYTAASPNLDLTLLHCAAEGVTIVRCPTPTDTVFRNRYQGGHREQLLLDRAAPLVPQDLPKDLPSIPLVLLGPVAQELSPTWIRFFPRSRVAACLQGWLRAWDRDGRVYPVPWAEAEHWLPHLTVGFLSEQDIGGEPALAEQYACLCPALVRTEGDRGATLYEQGRPRSVPPFPAREEDPTGAGDVFAAAFFVRYAEGASLATAGRFAAAAASLSVQGPGIESIPRRSAVEALLREGTDVVAAA